LCDILNKAGVPRAPVQSNLRRNLILRKPQNSVALANFSLIPLARNISLRVCLVFFCYGNLFIMFFSLQAFPCNSERPEFLLRSSCSTRKSKKMLVTSGAFKLIYSDEEENNRATQRWDPSAFIPLVTQSPEVRPDSMVKEKVIG
jgi:hypothetical protein